MAIAIVTAIVLCAIGYIIFRFTMVQSYIVYIIYFVISGAMFLILRKNTMKKSATNIDTDVYSE